MIGRKLRKELIAGNSGRSGEFGFLVDARPDFLSSLPRGRDALAIVGDVEIGLIEGGSASRRLTASPSEPRSGAPRNSPQQPRPAWRRVRPQRGTLEAPGGRAVQPTHRTRPCRCG